MKRRIYLPIIFIALLLLCISLIIPATVKKTTSVVPRVPETVVTRHMALKKGWALWWPDEKGISLKDSSSYSYRGLTFKIEKTTFTQLNVTVSEGNTRIPTVISLVPGRNMMTEVSWSFIYPVGTDPLNRLLRFRRPAEMEAIVGDLLKHFMNFVEDEKNVYGLDIEYAKVQDSLVMTTRSISGKYPTTAEVYEMVGKLQNFAGEKKIGKNRPPMLNIIATDDSRYRITVALPVLERADPPKDIAFSRLILGNILISEVRGGNHTVEQAFSRVKRFIEDRRHTSPAIPFQMLVTDRMAEPDTSKWITRIYYPIL
jgi:hypothetical protein